MKSKQYRVEQLGERRTTELKELLKSPYMEKLENQLTMEYTMNTIYPSRKDIFQYFRLCPFEKLRMVVMFKEPGVDISVFPTPYSDNYIDSIYNMGTSKIADCIYQEYYSESKELVFNFDHSFEYWAPQGVLILPTALTVRKEQSGGHIKYWRQFVEGVLKHIKHNCPGTVFLLWGEEAQVYTDKLVNNQHVFSWESPITAFKENRDWKCPSFKQVDVLLTYLNGEIHKIKW